MAYYDAPNIWYTQDSNLDRALNKLSDLAYDFMVGRRLEHEGRQREYRQGQINYYQKKTNVHPFDYGNPFENESDFKKYMANVTDFEKTSDHARDYTPRGGSLSPLAAEKVAGGIDPTPYHFTRDDVRTFESYLVGGTDLSKSVFWDGLINQSYLSDEDAFDLIDKGLLYQEEVDQWNRPEIRNQVKKRWSTWKEKFISENDVYSTDKEFSGIVNEFNTEAERKRQRLDEDPTYIGAKGKASGYGQSFARHFGVVDSDGMIEGWRVGLGADRKEYTDINEIPGFARDIFQYGSDDIHTLYKFYQDKGGSNSVGWSEFIGQVNKEDPDLARFVQDHINNWELDILNRRKSADLLIERDRPDWLNQTQGLLNEQELVNEDLAAMIPDYINLYKDLTSGLQSGQPINIQGQMVQLDENMVTTMLQTYLQNQLGNLMGLYSQNFAPNSQRFAYIASQGDLNGIFQRLLRNYMRSEGD